MKKSFILMRGLVLGILLSQTAIAAAPPAVVEDWKGPQARRQMTFGAMGGIGLYDPKAAFTIIPNFAFRIVDTGFAPDISNQVFLETAVGPIFVGGQSKITYSVHLRWDFKKDEQWTIYGLGGLGGNSQLAIYPRFGGGAFYKVTDLLYARAEASHEYVIFGAGVGW